MKIKQRFYKFLKDEGIWNLYWYNVRKYDKDNDVKRIRKIKDPEDYFNYAFEYIYSETFNIDDRFTFWCEIESKWLKILNKLENKISDEYFENIPIKTMKVSL